MRNTYKHFVGNPSGRDGMAKCGKENNIKINLKKI
jgi:hypothetical protein